MFVFVHSIIELCVHVTCQTSCTNWFTEAWYAAQKEVCHLTTDMGAKHIVQKVNQTFLVPY